MARNNRKTVAAGEQVRLICTLPNASTSISGVAFATVMLDEKAGPVHLSERLPAEKAEPFLACDGFAVWEGEEEAHARAIEDALDAARHAAPASAGGPSGASAAEGELRRQVAELTAANQAQARELRETKRQLEELRRANTELSGELTALKATGARAAA